MPSIAFVVQLSYLPHSKNVAMAGNFGEDEQAIATLITG
jgi:hypothetical protein